MSRIVALRVYEQLTDATDDKARAKIIAEAFSEIEERFPNLKDVATQRDLSETELRLQREIEKTRLETEKVRAEIKTVEANLQKEIEKTRLETEKVRVELKTVEVNLTNAINRQTMWVISAIASVVGGIRLLDWFLAHLPH